MYIIYYSRCVDIYDDDVVTLWCCCGSLSAAAIYLTARVFVVCHIYLLFDLLLLVFLVLRMYIWVCGFGGLPLIGFGVFVLVSQSFIKASRSWKRRVLD